MSRGCHMRWGVRYEEEFRKPFNVIYETKRSSNVSSLG